jgi:hypothetical protein
MAASRALERIAVDIYDIFFRRLEGKENHEMHFGLNNIWDEFSSDKNRDLINPILNVSLASKMFF